MRLDAFGPPCPGSSRIKRIIALAALGVPLLLTGCSLLPTTRKLPIPRVATVTYSTAPDELVARLNKRWEAINTLTAKVEFHASVSKTAKGTATDYPSVEGHILLRKPSDLRVVGQLLGVRVFDMASSGGCFTLSIPHNDKVIKGCGPPKTKSQSTWENLRPGFFFDAMIVRGLEPDDHYSVVNESETIEDAQRKHLFTMPEYVLSIYRTKAGSQQLIPVRVVTFHRDDLRPYQQDIYDDAGNLETEVFYRNYQDFEGSQYPQTVTIKRPLEEVQIVLTIEDVKENGPLGDEQFVVPIPKDSKIVTQP
jgi:hypothetical protein